MQVREEREHYDHEHTHGHAHTAHSHSHSHPHTQTKAVLNRLSRAIGHLESVRRMVEDGRDCTEVLVQLAAVRSALNSTAKVILKDHLEHCLHDLSVDDANQLSALNEAIDKFMD
ncbi:MAG: metal-sensing transcriptional repressor [Oscillospiraceae bacterium]|nr:metal-sensing transcriptional repressor [Oscillospiraceae bacterium]